MDDQENKKPRAVKPSFASLIAEGEELRKAAKEGPDKGFFASIRSWFKLMWYDKVTPTIVMGVIGMALGAVLFTWYSTYSEIKLKPQPMIDSLLKMRLTCLTNKLGKKKADTLRQAADYAPVTKKDTISVNTAIAGTKLERAVLSYGNADTSLLYLTKYLLLNRHVYIDAIDSGNWICDSCKVCKCKAGPYNDGKHKRKLCKHINIPYKLVPAMMVDSCKLCAVCNPPFRVHIRLEKDIKAKPIDFFRKYPQFGLWIVFSIAQMVLWSMILALIWSSKEQLNNKLPEGNARIGLKCVINYIILSLVLLLVFCWLFYARLLHKWLITDDYFLSLFQFRMCIYAFCGYGTAAVCFGIHITLANKLDIINKATKGRITRAHDPNLNKVFMALKSAFDKSFFCSALILSFCVLWTGILVSAVNSMDAFRLYFILSGKYFIPNDFVYLQGLMHTMILLIFYLPVRVKFNSMAIANEPAPASAGGALPPTKSVFSVLADSLGPLLITASPLLASLVHSLLALVVKN